MVLSSPENFGARAKLRRDIREQTEHIENGIGEYTACLLAENDEKSFWNIF